MGCCANSCCANSSSVQNESQSNGQAVYEGGLVLDFGFRFKMRIGGHLVSKSAFDSYCQNAYNGYSNTVCNDNYGCLGGGYNGYSTGYYDSPYYTGWGCYDQNNCYDYEKSYYPFYNGYQYGDYGCNYYDNYYNSYPEYNGYHYDEYYRSGGCGDNYDHGAYTPYYGYDHLQNYYRSVEFGCTPEKDIFYNGYCGYGHSCYGGYDHYPTHLARLNHCWASQERVYPFYNALSGSC